MNQERTTFPFIPDVKDSRIGLFGGSFDPIHMAHLLLAETVRAELNLDRILFMPAFVAPHKQTRTATEGFHRLQMIRLAIEDNPYFSVCDYELAKSDISYTVDTLEYLQRIGRFDRSQLHLLIGADNLKGFHTWKDPQRIVRLAQVVVVNRPEYEENDLPATRYGPFLSVSIPMMALSASEIRRRVADGQSIRYWTPGAVEKYIADHRLYRD
ncbi:MAG: Nicotinate-nucleotide adenylyltransferase [bacterium ADurb.Bin478]|nr:MAG: Nicotinate-nucleotide adenylyltransferase [bacterium ADurb.Bin478]